MNPFKFGRIVSGEDFCGRPELLTQLKQNLASGQNTYVQGERRIGKSSLIKQALLTSRGVKTVWVDLLAMKSTDELCREMVRGIVSMEKQTSFLQRVLGLLSSFRPALTFDPVTQSWSVSMSPSVRFTEQSVAEVMDVLEQLGAKSRLVVVLDEFQDVLGIDEGERLLALLRGKIQNHAKIAYLFAGSLRRNMERIFTHPDSPFFKSAVALEVGPLDHDTFVEFLRAKFWQAKRTVSDDALHEVFRLSSDNPGDVQQLCRSLWETTAEGESIGLEHLSAALEVIFAQESKGYQALLEVLSEQQLKCLLGLARVGGDRVTSREFIEASGVGLPSSIKKAFTRLEKTRTVFKKDGGYRFFNPFLGEWLLRRKA